MPVAPRPIRLDLPGFAHLHHQPMGADVLEVSRADRRSGVLERPRQARVQRRLHGADGLRRIELDPVMVDEDRLLERRVPGFEPAAVLEVVADGRGETGRDGPALDRVHVPGPGHHGDDQRGVARVDVGAHPPQVDFGAGLEVKMQDHLTSVGLLVPRRDNCSASRRDCL